MRDEGGFALMAALWLVVALSVIGLEVGLQSRHERLAAINTAELLQAEAEADAGIASVRAKLKEMLSNRRDRDPWFEIDLVLEDDRDLADVDVSVTDAGAKLNLNTATDLEIERLLQALRIDHGRAERIAQSILDWRDPDQAHRARGAERDQYIERGAPLLPRDGRLRTVSELRFVNQVDSTTYAKIVPYVTVVGSGRVSVNAAARPVLLALPGMTEEAVAAIERRRRLGTPVPDIQALARQLSPRARDRLEARLPALRVRTTFETREVEVVSTGTSPSGLSARVTALLVRGGESVFLVDRREHN